MTEKKNKLSENRVSNVNKSETILYQQIDNIKPPSLKINISKALNKFNDYTQEANYFHKINTRYDDFLTLKNKINKNPESLTDKVKKFDNLHEEYKQFNKEIKDENEHFHKLYIMHKKNKEEKAKKKNIHGINPNDIFKRLIAQYKEKGYIPPDLANDGNLFDTSPLMIHNNNILDYYNQLELTTHMTKDSSQKDNYHSDVIYIDKLHKSVNERLRSYGEKNTHGNVPYNVNTEKSLKDIREENEKLENEIKTKRELYEEYEKRKKINNHYSREKINSTNFTYLSKKDIFLNSSKYIPVITEANSSSKSILNKKSPLSLQSAAKRRETNVSEFSYNTGAAIFTKNMSSQVIKVINLPPIRLKTTKEIEQNESVKLNLNIKYDTIETLNDVRETKITENDLTTIQTSQNYNTNETYIKTEPFMILEEVNSSTKYLNSLSLESNSINSEDSDSDSVVNEDERINKLHSMYEKLTNKGNLDKLMPQIIKYFKDFKKKDKNLLSDTEGLEPSDLLKYISELKTKVSFTDFGSIYQNYTSKNGNLKINPNHFKKIKEYDEKINKLEFALVKELKKFHK